MFHTKAELLARLVCTCEDGSGNVLYIAVKDAVLASLVLGLAPRYYTPPPDENMLKNMLPSQKVPNTSSAKQMLIAGIQYDEK